jgi:hypothetical protein
MIQPAVAAKANPANSMSLPVDVTPSWVRPLGMLVHRTALFLVCQLCIAIVIAAQGQPNAFLRAAAWWPVSATVTSLITLGILRRLLRAEHLGWRAFLHIERGHVLADVAICIGVFVVCGPLVMLPSNALSLALYGSQTSTAPLIYQPLPYPVALVISILFPLTVALSELPAYLAYAMPRVERILGSRWSAVGAVLLIGFCLAAQHVTLPLVLDWRFMLWRLVMFLPFALWLAVSVRWRPRLLPYLMFGHFLIDFANAPMILAAAAK